MILETKKFRITDDGMLQKQYGFDPGEFDEWRDVAGPQLSHNRRGPWVHETVELQGLCPQYPILRTLDRSGFIVTFRIRSTGELIRWIGRDGKGTWDLWRKGGKVEEAYL